MFEGTVKLGMCRAGENENVSRLSASAGAEHKANRSRNRYTVSFADRCTIRWIDAGSA